MAGFTDSTLPDAVAAGVIRGNHEDIACAYEILSQPVMNLATRILQDRQLAEEVLQDVFIELLEKSAQIREARAIRGWVKKVAVNHCLMRLRSPWHKRRSVVDVHEILEREDAGDMETTGELPGLDRAMAALAPESRAVLWLHDVEGYTHKEIGELMGKTSSYSKSQLARAYQRLLRMLDGNAASGEKSRDTVSDGPVPAGARRQTDSQRDKPGNDPAEKHRSTESTALPGLRDEQHEQRRTGKDFKTPCPS